METHRCQYFLDLVERLAAEIRSPQHLGFRLLDQIADIDDVVVLQAVCRTDRQFELVDLLEQSRVESQFRNLFLRSFLLRLFEVDKDRQLVLENTSSIRHCVFTADRAICLDVQRQLVIIENLTFTGVLDLVRHLANRRIEAVNRDKPDWSIFCTIAVGRHIALAGVDGEFHADFSAFVQRADDVIRVKDLDIADSLNVASRNDAWAFLADDHALRALAFHADGDFLDVQNDIRNVFADARDRREFMQNAIDLNGGHGSAAKRRQKHATQSITERQTETAFQRFSNDGCMRAGAVGDEIHLVRLDEFLPVLLDHVSIPLSIVATILS